jgi:6-phosphogluconolactonase
LKPVIKIFANQLLLAEELAEELKLKMKDANDKKPFTLVLSGGSTPEKLFSVLAEKYLSVINWKYVHLFWGDERCVPPGHPESNYGNAFNILLKKIDIPEKNIHRIKGEEIPEIEAKRYSEEILKNTKLKNGLPSFDFVLLGIGDDGHTASIFPNQMGLMNSDKICELAYHPLTQQKRITLTGKIINNTESVAFLVTGKIKANIVSQIINNPENAKNYPAARISPLIGNLEWFLDQEAALLL